MGSDAVNYPDNFRGTSHDVRPLRGDDLEDAVDLENDFDALFAIDEARTAYRAALAGHKKYLSSAAQAKLAEYLTGDDDNYHDSGLARRLQSATELDL